MDKTAIKTFAINSRKKLMEDVEYKMSLVGINKEKINEPISSANGIETYQIGGSTNSIYDKDIAKREQLVKEVNEKGFENVVEEVAYTWFNRIIAIRFMEINNFLPTKTRVLSSETPGKIEPDIITEAFDVNLDFTQEDNELIFKLKDENKLDDLFRFLFIRQSNKLNEILPGLFEKTDDYQELLLNISFTNEDGVVRQLIDTIPEEDFGSQVEIIGWLYQFYNSELKDETFANLKKRIKICKERIPAATQLFTPDWIVKYMVENSLGRIWLEGHPNDNLKSKWKYYIEEAEQDPEVEQQLISLRKESEILKPEDITVIDPCMGSGHILVYVFEVLMDIYVSEGYTEKDACESILKNNLYGLDIDKRAYQLSYFAVLMKARKYNRRILTKNISPLLCSIEETNSISEGFINELILQDKTIESDLKYIISSFKDAKEYGCILNIKNINFDKISVLLNNFNLNNDLTKFKYQNEIKLLESIFNQTRLLSKKYDVVVTNPPYMGNNGMNSNLKEYIKSKYPLTKTDLFAVFLEKGLDMVKKDGFNCMVTMQSWMFLSSFEKFRKKLIESTTISNLLHMDNMVMRIAFGTSATVFRKVNLINYNSTFYHVKLSDVKNDVVNPAFFNDKNKFVTTQLNFNKIPSNSIAYWVDKSILNLFDNPDIYSASISASQNVTGNNKKYLRYFWEVNKYKINKEVKWIFYAKGGGYRKWIGNMINVIDWTPEAREAYRTGHASQIVPEEYWYKKGITWGLITSSKPSFRVLPEDSTFDKGGSSIFIKNDVEFNYILGLLNSNLFFEIVKLFNPTLNFQVKDIRSMPLVIEKRELINGIVEKCCDISNNDWNDNETSYNFEKHPFIRFEDNKLSEIFLKWQNYKEKQFNLLKTNEIQLNNLFSEIYNINIDCNVNDENVSIITSNYINDVKSFISYAIGCMFGRYSLDSGGLQFAGGDFNLDQYHKFIPDDDNIIPVLDSEYFEDDIVGRFIEFVKTCFGDEHLEENLEFIANALSKNKKPSRDKIREYLVKNFFNDHKKTYKKCPIYWQFSSGKENGFNCLVYMHRYEPSLVARIRTDYLHKTQKTIEQAIANCENIIDHSSSNTEITKATKDKAKLQKQLKETIEYDEALAHIANQNIEIDLDDGVKVNYAKFQNVEVAKEGKKSKTVNLLRKI